MRYIDPMGGCNIPLPDLPAEEEWRVGVDYLELSTMAVNALARVDITDISQLRDLGLKKIRWIHNIGNVTSQRIMDAVASYDEANRYVVPDVQEMFWLMPQAAVEVLR